MARVVGSIMNIVRERERRGVAGEGVSERATVVVHLSWTVNRMVARRGTIFVFLAACCLVKDFLNEDCM